MTLTQWDFKVVVDTMVDAVLSIDPPCQLFIGTDAKFLIAWLRMFPVWFRFRIMQMMTPSLVPEVMKRRRPKQI